MTAKPDTWMPLVIGDYLKDTTRLTTEQHGAYLLLIMSYWVDGPPLDDDEELAAITGLDARAWKKNRPKLQRFFRVDGGRWFHKRIDKEIERWSEKKAQYVARAAAGGRAKAAKSTASSTPQAASKHKKTAQKSCLDAAPQPASTEVEGPKEPSTLCSRERSEARADGASGFRVIEGGQSEADAWRQALAQARKDLPHFEREDPDFASEIAEFIAVAEAAASTDEVAA